MRYTYLLPIFAHLHWPQSEFEINVSIIGHFKLLYFWKNNAAGAFLGVIHHKVNKVIHDISIDIKVPYMAKSVWSVCKVWIIVSDLAWKWYVQ